MTLLVSVYIFLLGLIIGSFLNCLIWRLYKEESLNGRSYCPTCRHKISWYDNLPVISFIFLLGRCRHCKKTISWQYPVVEIITAGLFLLSFSVLSTSSQLILELIRAWLFIIVLIIVFVYDARWQLVPMNIVWPLTAVLFIINIFLGISLVSLIMAGVLTAGFFLLQYILTKKRGLGEGDIWLGLLIGITLVDFYQIFLSLFLAYLSGAMIGLWLMFFKGKNKKTSLALGPFLSFGAIITLIWGKTIIDWYLGWIF